MVNLKSESHITQRQGDTVNSQQNQVDGGYDADGCQGKQRVEKHQQSQNQTDDVNNHGEVVYADSGDEADAV